MYRYVPAKVQQNQPEGGFDTKAENDPQCHDAEVSVADVKWSEEQRTVDRMSRKRIVMRTQSVS